MSIDIKESFAVSAPVERVWRFLTTPDEVVQCIPGAALTEVLGDRQYAGHVKVKVGPITATYAGKATLTEVAEATRQMTLVGEGRETSGSGAARMTMRGTVSPNATGGADVRVDATIEIAGKVMQFGSGLVETVSAQLFKQFVEQARQRLETAPSEVSEVAGPGVLARARPAEVKPQPLRLIPLLARALLQRLRRIFVRRS